MSGDHTETPAGNEGQAKGGYGDGFARVVLWLFLLIALGFFIPFAWIVDEGILKAVNAG